MSDPVTLLDGNGNVVNTFTTIQAAVDAASNGYTIEVAPGTYQEQVTVNGLTNLTIEGTGSDSSQTIIESPDYTDLVSNIVDTAGFEYHPDTDAIVGVENGGSITVSNLTVNGNGQGLVYAEDNGDLIGIEGVNASVTANNVHVEGTEDVESGVLQGGIGNTGIVVSDNNDSAQTVTVTNSTVDSFQRDGILLNGAGLTANVSGDTVTGVGTGLTNGISQNLVELDNGATGTIANDALAGINDDGLGFLAYNADGVTFSGNTVSGLAGNTDSIGAFFAGGDGATAENNSFTDQGTALADDGGSPEFLGFSDPFTTALAQSDNTYTGNVESYFFYAGPTTTNAWLVAGTGGPDDLEGGAGNDVFTVSGGAPNGNIFVGNAGIDTVQGYGAGSTLAIQSGQWVVTNGSATDTLTGIEKVVIDGQTYDLVDNLGQNVGGFQTVQAAIDNSNPGDILAEDTGTTIIYFDRTLTATDANTVVAAAGTGPVQLRIAPPSAGNVALTITLTGVPSYGTLAYLNGSTPVPVTTGATLTGAQLADLEYTPPASGEDGGQSITYTVSDGTGTVHGAIAVSVVTDDTAASNLYFAAFGGTGNAGNPDLYTLDGNGNPLAIPLNVANGSFAGEDGGFFQSAGDLYFNANGSATSDTEALYQMAPNGTVTPVSAGSDNPDGFFDADNGESANFTEFDGSLYFHADVDTGGVTGGQLVKLNADGSSQIFTLDNGFDSNAGQNGGFVAFNGDLYFSAVTPSSTLGYPDLIQLDSSGTVTDITAARSGDARNAGEDGGFYVFNNTLYFNAHSTSLGTDTLFALAAGSTAPTPVDPTGAILTHDPGVASPFHDFDGSLYFNATSVALGDSTLFRLGANGVLTPLTYNNGITNETLEQAGALGGFTDFAGATYFIATTVGEGTQLFKLDASGNITAITSMAGGAFSDSLVSGFVNFDGNLYFDANDAGGGDSLFKLTAGGTLTTVDLGNAPGAATNAGVDGGFQVVNGSLYFSAYTPQGYELVQLKADGTTQVFDIAPGASNNSFDTTGLNNAIGIFPNNVLEGTAGNDILVGSAPAETIDGGAGNDVLDGRGGDDVLTGGDGADTFVFSAAGPGNVDTVTDYSFAQGDTVDVSALVDANFTGGSQVADFVRVIASGADLILQVDPDGPANGETWEDVAILQNANTSPAVEVTAFFAGADYTLHLPPVVTTSGGTVTWDHGGAPVTVDAAVTLSEPDGQSDLASATVGISGFTVGDGDVLAIAAADLTGSTVTGTSITESFNSTTGVLTLSGSDTVAHYQAALRDVIFSSTAASPSASPRTIAFAVNDGVAQGSGTDTVDVHDQPVVTAGASATFDGGGPAVVLDSGLTVTDASSGTLANATVTIVSPITGDTLSVGNAGGLSVNYASGVLTLSGPASVATYRTALQSVTYGFSPSSGDPTDGGADTSRTIDWAVNDGTLSSTTAASTLTTVPPPATPSGLALSPTSDSGVQGDDITNVTTPTITGNGAAGDTVTLDDGATVVGTGTVGGGGAWSVATSTLAAGGHSLSATESDGAGDLSAVSAALAITIDTALPVTTPQSLSVAGDSGASAIGIAAPSDANFAAAALAVTVSGLPADGTVLLADGVTPVSLGESLTVAQLTGLEFEPPANQFEQSSSLTYSVADPAGNSAAGSASLSIQDPLPGETVDVPAATSFDLASNANTVNLGAGDVLDVQGGAGYTINGTGDTIATWVVTSFNLSGGNDTVELNAPGYLGLLGGSYSVTGTGDIVSTWDNTSFNLAGGNDTVELSSNDYLGLLGGSYSVHGTGNDTIATWDDTYFNLAGGNDTVDLSSNDYLGLLGGSYSVSSTGNDTIATWDDTSFNLSGGNDTVELSSNDYLGLLGGSYSVSSTGNDTIATWDDTSFNLSGGNDTVELSSNDYVGLLGGSGYSVHATGDTIATWDNTRFNLSGGGNTVELSAHDYLGLLGGGGGADTVTGFSEGSDYLLFSGENASNEAAAVASAQLVNGNTVLTLPNQTSLVLVGVTHVDTGIFA